MELFEVIVKGVINGCTYALMAIGLALVYGLLRILHIAHATLFTLGAYTGLLTANASGSIALGMLAAMLVAGVAGMLIYRLAYQPVLKHPPHVPLIISVGLFIVMEDGFRILFGGYGLSFNDNPYNTSTVVLFGITFNYVEIAMVASAVVLIGLFVAVVSRTRMGIGWRATVSDPEMALSFGVNPIRVRYINFFIGSALGAVAGMLVALMTNLVEPGMGATLSYKGLAIVVLGGLGSIYGTLLASLALGVVEALGSLYLSSHLDPNALGFLFLIIVLMIRPQGLLARA
jgi:branched-chain amino acid transport system permease protein